MVRFEDRGRIIAIMNDGTQVGTINPNQANGVGWSIFGSPHMGVEKTLDAAKEKVSQALS